MVHIFDWVVWNKKEPTKNQRNLMHREYLAVHMFYEKYGFTWGQPVNGTMIGYIDNNKIIYTYDRREKLYATIRFPTSSYTKQHYHYHYWFNRWENFNPEVIDLRPECLKDWWIFILKCANDLPSDDDRTLQLNKLIINNI